MQIKIQKIQEARLRHPELEAEETRQIQQRRSSSSEGGGEPTKNLTVFVAY